MNWQFWSDNQFLAWSALWLVWGVIYGVVLITTSSLSLIFKVVNRILRTIKVLFRGWPPEHLDADGDWREATQPDEENEGWQLFSKKEQDLIH